MKQQKIPPPTLSNYLDRAVDQLEHSRALREMQHEEGIPKQQLNLRVPSSSLQALEQIAEHYGENRTGVATNLLTAAIADVCDHLGIDWEMYVRKELEAQGWKFDDAGNMTRGPQ